MVTNVDLAQTSLDAVGVDHRPRMQDRSFWHDPFGARCSRGGDQANDRYGR